MTIRGAAGARQPGPDGAAPQAKLRMISADGPVSTRAMTLAAVLVVEQHETDPAQTTYRPGTCARCSAQGCPQLAWARQLLDADTPVADAS